MTRHLDEGRSIARRTVLAAVPALAAGPAVAIIKHANLSSVKVRRDGVDIYEDIPVAVANQRQIDFGRVPQAGYQVIDFMPDSLQSNALNTAFIQVSPTQAVPVQNLDVRMTTSAADTLTIYTESYSLNSQI